jgi:hypothetical protein
MGAAHRAFSITQSGRPDSFKNRRTPFVIFSCFEKADFTPTEPADPSSLLMEKKYTSKEKWICP